MSPREKSKRRKEKEWDGKRALPNGTDRIFSKQWTKTKKKAAATRRPCGIFAIFARNNGENALANG
ncbi:hypothetical protein [Prevotella dentalis]|uniref:hypothetical protein n=1 Tax=Prevotella dentalis TaxID=52227 RepID=UPI0012B5D1D1|nr:hypothetical protein [Prevotella dentalis]